jgi:hypothetical protein
MKCIQYRHDNRNINDDVHDYDLINEARVRF